MKLFLENHQSNLYLLLEMEHCLNTKVKHISKTLNFFFKFLMKGHYQGAIQLCITYPSSKNNTNKKTTHLLET